MSDIDCRGKACPEPVLMAKEALETLERGEITVIVDDPSSCNNVQRFAESQGCSVKVERKENDFYLFIQKGDADKKGERTERERPQKLVVYVNSSFLGMGDEALGSILMRSFLKTLQELKTKPSRLILINSGVRLASEGSDVLETLRALSQQGVEILSCGTCLDFYGLKEKLKVGAVSNMYEIAQSLLEADRLIRP